VKAGSRYPRIPFAQFVRRGGSSLIKSPRISITLLAGLTRGMHQVSCTGKQFPFMFYYFGLIFSLFCSSWGHIQKATLKFLAIHHKLEKNRPLGSVMSDLLADTKKAYYEQEGKQFMYEPAWN
jgi:hypothetical protein